MQHSTEQPLTMVSGSLAQPMRRVSGRVSGAPESGWTVSGYEKDERTPRGFVFATVDYYREREQSWSAHCTGPEVGESFEGRFATADEAKAAVEAHIAGTDGGAA